MLVELTSTKETHLNKWFRVVSIDDMPQQNLYVRFSLAYDANGNSLYKVPKTDVPIYVDMEYSGTGYP